MILFDWLNGVVTTTIIHTFLSYHWSSMPDSWNAYLIKPAITEHIGVDGKPRSAKIKNGTKNNPRGYEIPTVKDGGNNSDEAYVLSNGYYFNYLGQREFEKLKQISMRLSQTFLQSPSFYFRNSDTLMPRLQLCPLSRQLITLLLHPSRLCHNVVLRQNSPERVNTH